MNAVFVYGLLKPGFSLHHVVAPYIVRTAPGRARGRLYDAGLPAARFDEDGDIAGFVLWLDAGRLTDALRELDDLEDEGDVYRRIVIGVETADGHVDAYAYQYLYALDGRASVGSDWSAS